MGAFDGFRTLFNVRRERSRPPPGPKPKLGAKIWLHDVRMTVQAGMSDEMWKWLLDLGFREVTYAPDRRRYRDLPPSMVTRLFDSPRDDWRSILKQAIRESAMRPTPGPKTHPLRAGN